MDGGKRSYSSSKSVGKNKFDKTKDLSKTNSRLKLFEQSEDGPVTSMSPGPIHLPIVKQIDVSRVLPRYNAVLSRTPKEGVGMEDLDQVQQDLEKLLSTCAVRQRNLKSELESMDKVDEKKEKKGKPFDKQPSAKRKRVDEKVKYKDARNVSRILKTKQTVPVNSFINDLTVRYEVPKVIIPKHDVSDRFWLSVDPYCQEVGRDNVCFLDELIQECSQEIDVKIPEIGEHYALEWAENTIQSEQTNGNMKNVKKQNNSPYNNEIKKNGINNSSVDTFPSPLTQRLLDTLIEEKVIKQIPTVFEKLKSGDYTIKSNNGVRSGLCLDRRLRKELVEQGILEVEDLPKTFPPDDEILLEIKKCQHELSVVNKHNIFELNKLRTAVAKDLRKQEVKAALEKVDAQVLNMYNKILIAKQKHAADAGDSSYDKYLLPEFELEEEAANIIKQQVLLHRELTDLTDFTLIN